MDFIDLPIFQNDKLIPGKVTHFEEFESENVYVILETRKLFNEVDFFRFIQQ